MDRTEITVLNMLTAIEAPLYHIGVLSDGGMLRGLDGIPADAVLARLSLLKSRNARGSHIYIRPAGEHRYTALDDLSESSLRKLAADGFNPCAVIETSAGNFQAWLKHSVVFPKLLSTFAAQTLAARYDSDLSAADWRRFGRLPGFTNCKPKYKRPDGLFPFVRLKSHSGKQYPGAEAFAEEITKRYQEQEQQREAKRQQASLSPHSGPRSSNLSLERFRISSKYRDRPAAADIALCVAAYANRVPKIRSNAPSTRNISPAIPAFPSAPPISGDDGKGKKMGRAAREQYRRIASTLAAAGPTSQIPLRAGPVVR